MEFLTQQFYFRKPIRFARVKIVLLNPRGAWFQHYQQLQNSAQRRDCSKKWALWKCHNILLQHCHLMVIFLHVIASLLNTKSLLNMPKIHTPPKIHMNQSFAFSHKTLFSFQKALSQTKDIYLFMKNYSFRTPYSFPSLFMWVHHRALLPLYFGRLSIY